MKKTHCIDGKRQKKEKKLYITGCHDKSGISQYTQTPSFSVLFYKVYLDVLRDTGTFIQATRNMLFLYMNNYFFCVCVCVSF
jgi:hypothetical protein